MQHPPALASWWRNICATDIGGRPSRSFPASRLPSPPRSGMPMGDGTR
ncbi:hypothetical protein [Allokutzneria oryzae]|uniref:Uncharacterized protein n=1 Tax=Allokutzneria oryzae TaxID=1378989 RepID=A0ABV6A7C0_9PSEU